MKMKHGLIWVVTLFTGLATVLAADAPPPLAAPGGTPAPAAPATPPPAAPASNAAPAVTATAAPAAASTNAAAAKKTAKKKDTTTKKSPAPAAPLPVNELAASKQNNVNVRGQARINSEIVTHLKQGQTVTVLEDVTIKHPKPDEPSLWARIALPAGTHVWIHTSYINETNQTIKPTKLNIRSGAGENYSVVGTLAKGDAVKPLSTKGDWTEIEAPASAYGFVAAHLLMHKSAAEVPVTPPPVPPETVVQNSPPIAAPATNVIETPAPATPPATPPAVTPDVAPAPAPDEPPPKRIVQREGIVSGTVSIQAPSHYQLKSLDDGRIIDYLYTTSTNVVLKKYDKRTVLVSGEEELDERWPNTPVITIQKIQVVE
jgi:uncharacterized protein YgiM (DUF1202 family)